MPGARVNLTVAAEAMRDMLSHSKEVGNEIEEFLLQLAENLYAPELLKVSVDHRDLSYHHQLPSGCFIFWEILLPLDPSFTILHGVRVRVTGARFDHRSHGH